VPLPDDDALLRELAAALTAPPLPTEPPRHHLDLLKAAVAFHVEPAGPPPRPQPPRRRLAARRTVRVGTMAASLVLAVASAAAASGITSDGLALPRPLRAVAEAVGLPVASVALDDTRQHLRALREAARSHDHPRVQRVVAELQEDISRLPEDERREAQPEVEIAVAQAAGSLNIPSAPTVRVEAHGPTDIGPVRATAPPVIDDPEPFSADAAGSATDTDHDDRPSEETPPEVTAAANPPGVDTAAGSAPEATDPAPTADGEDPATNEHFSNLQATPLS
jgi:hypothetical protein